MRSGPLNNEVAIEKRIPIHLTYFTAWVDDAGRLNTFADIYGHEKRIVLALEGKWDQINKGRDHLAPVQPNFDPSRAPPPRVAAQTYRLRGQRQQTVGDYIGNALGIGF
jgi:L,D-transpeptidase YcbB